MVMSLATNVASLSTYHSLSRTSSALETAQRRLSTGYRISRAADDAAGLGISEGLRSQIGGMRQAVRNAQDGISVLQIADGALAETTAALQRMRDLAVEAANDGALDAQSKAALQKEMVALGKQVDSIATTTSFNGTKLLDGTYSGTFQVGADVGDVLVVNIGGHGFSMGTQGLGLSSLDVTASYTVPTTVTPAVSAAEGGPSNGHLYISGDFVDPGFEQNFRDLQGTISYDGKTFDLGSVDYTGAVTVSDHLQKLNVAAQAALGTSGYPFTATSAQLAFAGDTPGATSTHDDAVRLTPGYTGRSGADRAITMLDAAIAGVGSTRAELGATENRFQATVDRLAGAIGDTTASESRIRDTDVASTVRDLSRNGILMQAGSAMLAQAGRSSETLLKLLAA